MEYNKESLEFGERLVKMRTQKNITIVQVVDKMHSLGCDISEETYSNLEIGIRHIRIDELKCLKEIFDVSFEDLLYDK